MNLINLKITKYNFSYMKQLSSYMIISSILILLFNIQLYPRENYVKGFIILNNNDTIHGWIEYNKIKSDILACYFSTDSLSLPTRYKPRDIKGFEIPREKKYASRIVEIEGEERHLFLLYLVDGTVDLFYFRELDGQIYCFIEKEGKILPLTNEQKEYSQNDQKYIRKTNQYKNVFKYITKETPELHPIINNLEYHHSSFMKLVSKYHNKVCDSVDCVIYNRDFRKIKKPPLRIKLGIEGGLTLGYVRYQDAYEYMGYRLYNSNSEPAPEYEPSISSNVVNEFDEISFYKGRCLGYTSGFCMNVSRTNRSSLQLDFYYSMKKYSFKDFSLQSESFILPIQIRKDFESASDLSLFVNAGFSFIFSRVISIENFYLSYVMPEYNPDTGNFIMKTTAIDNPSFKYISQVFGIGSMLGIGTAYKLGEHSSLHIHCKYHRSSMQGTREHTPVIHSSPSLTFRTFIFSVGYSYQIRGLSHLTEYR